MSLPGFTLTDAKSPQEKMRKLIERADHIDQQMKELEDKKWIILSELSDLNDECGAV
jgi:hypothetical protein